MPDSRRLKRPLLVLVGVRALVAAAAVPLAPPLYRRHFLVLVLLRPTKDVFLFGGFLVKRGSLNLGGLLAAAAPLSVLGVWLMFLVGRSYADEIGSGDLPSWARRILRPERIQALGRVLDEKGARLVFLGRLAAFPSTVVAAAAGASGMDARPFLVADGLGALASVAETVTAGYLLGQTYERAGPWLTAVGVAVLAAGAVLLGRYLKRDPGGGAGGRRKPRPATVSGA